MQVRRLQPGDALRLFNGRGGEWAATVQRMGRTQVVVEVGEFDPVERELALAVTVALGMPANERMDLLVEKATELGVHAIQPLLCARSVLRLAGERAQRKREHWQAIAVAAAEQCGRTRVPAVQPVRALAAMLADPTPGAQRLLLSPSADVPALRDTVSDEAKCLLTLSGPEGVCRPTKSALHWRTDSSACGLGRASCVPRPRPWRCWLGWGCASKAQAAAAASIIRGFHGGSVMGLLDVVAGALGGASGEGGSGGLGGLGALGELLGGGQGQGSQADLLKLVLGLLAGNGQGGGLAGLVQSFQQAGLGDQISSWIGSGQNLPVSGEQLGQVFGSEQMSQMAERMGLSTGDLGAQLSQLLPQAVDKLTPGGQMPDGGLGGLGELLGRLTRG